MSESAQAAEDDQVHFHNSGYRPADMHDIDRLDRFWADEGIKCDFIRSYKFRSNVVFDDQGLFNPDDYDSDDAF